MAPWPEGPSSAAFTVSTIQCLPGRKKHRAEEELTANPTGSFSWAEREQEERVAVQKKDTFR